MREMGRWDKWGMSLFTNDICHVGGGTQMLAIMCFLLLDVMYGVKIARRSAVCA
jgi:hypothetical protein